MKELGGEQFKKMLDAAEEVVKEAGYDQDLPKRWTPRRFAQFLIKYAPQSLDFTPTKILHKFPKMRTSEKMVAKMMNHPEFRSEIAEIIALIKERSRLAEKYYLYVQNLVDRTWKFPSVKVAEHLGVISGEYVPVTKNITDQRTSPLSPEAEDTLVKAVAEAIKSQKNREVKGDESERKQ